MSLRDEPQVSLLLARIHWPHIGTDTIRPIQSVLTLEFKITVAAVTQVARPAKALGEPMKGIVSYTSTSSFNLEDPKSEWTRLFGNLLVCHGLPSEM
jgi:hypothetical protein